MVECNFAGFLDGDMVLKIKGIEHLSAEQLQQELQRGGKFVIYQYCISVLVMSFKRNSSIYFVPAHQDKSPRRLRFIGISLLMGWWGLPWGPIWTWRTVANNIRGGIDVTKSVQISLQKRKLQHAA